MRLFLIALTLACNTHAFAQTDLPAVPATGDTLPAFVPEGWEWIDTGIGDLNNDTLDDVVMVLQCRDTILGDTTGLGGAPVLAAPRKLVVLFGTGTGYRLVLDNNRFMLRSNEGGGFDPFEKADVKDGKLVLRFYGGSAWRYARSYTFRWQQEAFVLVAAEAANFHVPSGEGTKHAYDFLTHRLTTTTGKVDEDSPGYTTEVHDLPPMELRTFDTFVRPFTWKVNPLTTL